MAPGMTMSENMMSKVCLPRSRMARAPAASEARLLATSGRKAFASLRAGTPIPLPPPDPAWEKDVEPFNPSQIETQQSISFVGSPATVKDGVAAFVERMQPDELIVVSHIYDHAARLRSYELSAGLG